MDSGEKTAPTMTTFQGAKFIRSTGASSTNVTQAVNHADVECKPEALLRYPVTSNFKGLPFSVLGVFIRNLRLAKVKKGPLED